MRGEDEKFTILFFDQDLPPTDPNKIWTCPFAIKVSAVSDNRFLSKIISDSKRKTNAVEVENASKIKKGDWVILKVKNNDKDLIAYDLQPLIPEPEWKSILKKGIIVNELDLKKTRFK